MGVNQKINFSYSIILPTSALLNKGVKLKKMGVWEVQLTGCKTDSRMYCMTQGIYPIFCKNCKWKVTFKNCIKNLKIFKCRFFSKFLSESLLITMAI